MVRGSELRRVMENFVDQRSISSHVLELGLNYVLPAGVTDGGEDNFLPMSNYEAGRNSTALRAFIAHQEFGQNPNRGFRPVILIQDQ